MVTFVMIYEDEKIAEYWYFPECGRIEKCTEENPHGVITFFKDQELIEITKAAPQEKVHKVTVEELIESRNFFNKERIEQGLPEFTEEEYPTPIEGFISHFYADHVTSQIMKAYEKQGVLIKKGTAIWY